uniref:Uncharacterized protein n=1 Tax=Anopheles culicifacies TaxID=139723 RepID=A0A182MGY0_9DIPT
MKRKRIAPPLLQSGPLHLVSGSLFPEQPNMFTLERTAGRIDHGLHFQLLRLVLLLFRERNFARAKRFGLWRRGRQMHVQWIAQSAQIVLDLRDLSLDVVVFGQIHARLLRCLMQRDQVLTIFHVR